MGSETIVLIHGFWVTPRSWEQWIERYEQAGHRVIAPAYPGFDVEVEALNADPSPIESVTVPQIIERLESIIRELESPPILIGHSAGGVFTQILLDHGFGAAGVAINSAPTEGVRRVPLSQIKATFPVLKTPPTATGRSASRSSSGTTRSPTGSPRTRRGGCTSATTSPPRARSSGAARWPTSTRARTTTG
jgi:pimeloyl-ACP methyl ester carboxylesterase